MKLSDRIEQMVGPIHGLPSDLDTLLDQWLGKSGRPESCSFVPRSNIVEQEKEFVVTMELPGVAIADIVVEAADERLKIAGDKKMEPLSENEKLRRSERPSGKFERLFEFKSQVDFDRIEADLRNGILKIRVPKSEKVLPRKIQISADQ